VRRTRTKKKRKQNPRLAVINNVKHTLIMKKPLLLTVCLFATSLVVAAESTPADQIKEAIGKLNSATNYSWTTTLKMPDMPFEPGPIKGQAEKGGLAKVSQEMNEWNIEAVFKGDKVVLKNENEWRLLDEIEGPGAMMGGFLTRNGTAVEEAEGLMKKVKEIKAGEAGLYTADLTDAGAKEALTFSPRRGGGGPEPKEAKGSAKFWLKDGEMVKFESRLQGKVTFGPDGEERDIDVTRTTELQDVGKTVINIPAEAAKKFETNK
jgi:hypothetical protein